MDLKEYLKAHNQDADEIVENLKAVASLLDLANVPDKFITRVLVAYVMVVTGTKEELDALYVANHLPEPEG